MCVLPCTKDSIHGQCWNPLDLFLFGFTKTFGALPLRHSVAGCRFGTGCFAACLGKLLMLRLALRHISHSLLLVSLRSSARKGQTCGEKWRRCPVRIDTNKTLKHFKMFQQTSNVPRGSYIQNGMCRFDSLHYRPDCISNYVGSPYAMAIGFTPRCCLASLFGGSAMAQGHSTGSRDARRSSASWENPPFERSKRYQMVTGFLTVELQNLFFLGAQTPKFHKIPINRDETTDGQSCRILGESKDFYDRLTPPKIIADSWCYMITYQSWLSLVVD